MPRVTVDNQEVEVTAGSNLLAACRKAGIDVPALCFLPGCEPNTACMACMVKIKGEERIVPSCATRAEDGMVIESETEEIRDLRRTALELMLSDHGDPPGPDAEGYPYCTCSKSDICRLRKYAEIYEADPGRYRGERRGAGRTYEHPEIAYDPRKCILCGICVELARQAGEPLGLTVVGRGFDVRVDVPFDESLAKALQRAARRCAGACPTGALSRVTKEE
jgi:NADH dehydrogenase/NADH:ubiquinone oxidoreductase subunit G